MVPVTADTVHNFRQGISYEYRDWIDAHKHQSIDLEWLHWFLSGDQSKRMTTLRAYWIDQAGQSVMEDFESSLRDWQRPKELFEQAAGRIRAIILCHKDSCSVDRDIIDLLGARFDLDARFLRDHFDYENIPDEDDCPQNLLALIDQDSRQPNEPRVFRSRKSARLPSEKLGRYFQFITRHDCMSINLNSDLGGAYDSL